MLFMLCGRVGDGEVGSVSRASSSREGTAPYCAYVPRLAARSSTWYLQAFKAKENGRSAVWCVHVINSVSPRVSINPLQHCQGFVNCYTLDHAGRSACPTSVLESTLGRQRWVCGAETREGVVGVTSLIPITPASNPLIICPSPTSNTSGLPSRDWSNTCSNMACNCMQCMCAHIRGAGAC